MRQVQLYKYLLDALKRRGVKTIFGIPGDFVLNLFHKVEMDRRFKLLTFSHEPAVGFAAQGAARGIKGLGVCLVTYGAGALNMVNPVAEAYAEKTPLIIISGGPGRDEKKLGVSLHHQVKSFQSQLNVYKEVTEAQAVLDDPQTAAHEIQRVLNVAQAFALPVYIEVPRDMVEEFIPIPNALEKLQLRVNEGGIQEAGDELVTKLTASRSPILMVGEEVHRFDLTKEVIKLAERVGIPVVSSFMGRGTFPTHHPLYLGTYLGAAGDLEVCRKVEESDCLILLGVILSDTNMGVRIRHLNRKNLIICFSRYVESHYHRYEDVPLEQLLRYVLKHPRLFRSSVKAWEGEGRQGLKRSPEKFLSFSQKGRIGCRDIIAVVNDFFHKEGFMPLVVDTGDCLFASCEMDTEDVVASAYYATMGFAVPAAIGFQAATGKRPLVLVGDGAFQMTGMELAQCIRYGLNPIVVVFNNKRWEMLQPFLPEARFNDILNWPYDKLGSLLGGWSHLATSPQDFYKALKMAKRQKRFSLIEAPLQSGDISRTLRSFVDLLKKGRRGK